MDLLKQDTVIKALSVTAVAFLIDKYYLGIDDIQSSLMFSGAVGASMFIGNYLSSISPEMYDLGMISENKSVDFRLMEVTYSSLANFIINNKILKNGFYQNPGVATAQLLVYDVLGEYLKDYVQGNNISYLDNTN